MSLIDNVIENAIKYSPQGGRVAVDLFRRRRPLNSASPMPGRVFRWR